jgi:type 1 glutamine amidotransferase
VPLTLSQDERRTQAGWSRRRSTAQAFGVALTDRAGLRLGRVDTAVAHRLGVDRNRQNAACVASSGHTGDLGHNFLPYRIEMLPAAADHPITQGIADFDLVTEQYWVLTDALWVPKTRSCDLHVFVDEAAETVSSQRPVYAPDVWGSGSARGRLLI